MKLVYLTAQHYPSRKVDPFYWRSMAESFAHILGTAFTCIVRGGIPNDLKWVNTISIGLPYRFRSIFYFLFIPKLVWWYKWNDRETFFFSADSYLLSILIFWRKFFGFKYSVCSDWHQMFSDWRDRYIALNSDYLVSTSERLKKLLIAKTGINADKILVAYGGVDGEIFAKKSKVSKKLNRLELDLPEDKFLVGYVGGFKSVGQEKGIDTMIKSLKYLDQGIRMVFVGGPRDYSGYEDLVKTEGVEDRCIFVPKQSFEKVIEYEMAMDALVIPYPDKLHFRDYGFPLKVWEYMASGRPIIYSRLEIIDEVLKGRGTPFEPDNIESLVEAITNVNKNNQEVEKIALQNSRDIRTYTWQARARKILNFIKK